MKTNEQTLAELRSEIHQDILAIAGVPCLAVHQLQCKVDRLVAMQTIPDGFAVVPVVPTPEMVHAAYVKDREEQIANFGADGFDYLLRPKDTWIAMFEEATKKD